MLTDRIPSTSKPGPGTRLAAAPWRHLPEFTVLTELGARGSLNWPRGQMPSTVVGSVGSIVPGLGRCLFNAAAGDRMEFNQQSTSVARDLTMALMVRWRSFGTNSRRPLAIGDPGETASGYFLSVGTTGEFGLLIGNTAINGSGLTITTGVPYFALCSRRNSDLAQTWVLRRMDDGSILSATNTGANAGGSGLPGIHSIGSSTGNLSDYDVAAAWILPRFMTLPEALQWARQPYAGYQAIVSAARYWRHIGMPVDVSYKTFPKHKIREAVRRGEM